jgi:hypothetical protein
MRTHGSIFVVVTCICILKIPWQRVEHVLEKTKRKEIVGRQPLTKENYNMHSKGRRP